MGFFGASSDNVVGLFGSSSDNVMTYRKVSSDASLMIQKMAKLMKKEHFNLSILREC
jgi:hypothetical protein